MAGGNTNNLAEVAGQTASGKFVGSVGSVSKVARLALQGEKNQAAVWAGVATTNASSGVEPATSNALHRKLHRSSHGRAA